MKKSELKKELEIAKATLELAMVALRVAAEKNKKLSQKEPQAGDKIVETNNSDWFTKNDDGSYTIKLSPNTDITRWLKKEGDSNVTGWNETTQNDFNEQEEIDRANYKEFKQRDKEPKKETPLAYLNKEVEIEKQANELIDHFMPLVNGWREDGPTSTSKDVKIHGVVHSWSMSIRRKNAIKVAIRHCELKAMFIPLSSMVQNELVIEQLQKMLSQ